MRPAAASRFDRNSLCARHFSPMDDAALRLIPASLWFAIIWLAESFTVAPRPRRIRHGVRNLTLAGLNGLILFFTVGLFSIAVCANSPDFSSMPLSVTHGAVCFLVLDLFSYLWHRLAHAVPLLWRIHCVHHSDDQMDVSTAGRFHVAELAITAILRLPILYVLGVNTSVLLAYETALVAVSMLHHSSISLGRSDALLRLLITTPSMHSVHHSRDPVHFGFNFASVFSFWDRIFSTYRIVHTSVTHGLAGCDGKSFISLLTMPLDSPRRDVVNK